MKKNALITGATGGIGMAIVDILSKKFNLILVARNEEKLEQLSSKNNSVLQYIKCDLSNPNEIKGLIEKINMDNLAIDVLVNNAGINDDSLFENEHRKMGKCHKYKLIIKFPPYKSHF